MKDYRYVADFYDALHQAGREAIIFFRKALKGALSREKSGLLWFLRMQPLISLTAVQPPATLPILDCGAVDFLAAPGVYNNREPGGSVAQREMQDSFRLRGQMFVAEEDSRTHLKDFLQGRYGTLWMRDSIVTLKGFLQES